METSGSETNSTNTPNPDFESVKSRVVQSDVLCFLQNYIGCTPHDTLVKLVMDFYTNEDVEVAKKVLFEQTSVVCSSREKKRIGPQKKYNETTDMLNRLNECGQNIPTYVATNLKNLPCSTADCFDLVKLTKEVSELLKELTQVTMHLLRRDIGLLKQQLPGSGSPLPAEDEESCSELDAGEVNPGSNMSRDDSSEADGNTGAVPPPVASPRRVRHLTPSAPPVVSPCRLQPLTPSAPPLSPSITTEAPSLSTDSDAAASDDGFTVVKPRPRAAYSHAVKQPAKPQGPKPKGSGPQRKGASSSHRRPVPLRAAPDQRRSATLRAAPEQQRSSPKEAQLFVTRLHCETTTQDITSHIRSMIGACRDLTVTQLKAKYNTYASFKVSLPMGKKSSVENIKNWPSRVLVKRFFSKKV